MKILVLSYEYPPIGGGGGIICKNISENLAELGNEVTVLTTEIPVISNRLSVIGNRLLVRKNPKSYIRNPKLSISEIRNLTVIRLNSLRKNVFESNPLEMLSWIRTTKRFIRENPGFVDFEVCMAHFVLPGGEVALWLKKNYGLPYVLISHGHEIPWVHPRQMLLFHMGAYGWIKKVCQYAEFNFVQTGMMKLNIDRFLGRKYRVKNIIVPNGVDKERFYPDYSKRPHQLRIIFTGRLVIQKDPMTFLKAIKQFREYTIDFEVHILGDGNLRNRMERYVQKSGLAGNVKFLGKVQEDTMLEEYQAAHVMVAPSLNEGMSISALEALSCGVYLIATRASGYEEMIREEVNGDFVQFRDPLGLSKKLITYCEKRIFMMGTVAIPDNLTANDYDWEAVTGEYLHFLGPIGKRVFG